MRVAISSIVIIGLDPIIHFPFHVEIASVTPYPRKDRVLSLWAQAPFCHCEGTLVPAAISPVIASTT